MEVGRRRSIAGNGVVAGSVWESRMKIDEVKGGIKVFNGEESSEENDGDKKWKPKQSVTVAASGKRKTWKSQNSDGSPIQIARQRRESAKNMDEQLKELSASADGIRKFSVQTKKTRSELGKELSVSVDGIEKSHARSEEARELSSPVERIEKTPIQIRKVKSESQNLTGESGNGIERNPMQLRKVKSDNRALDGSVDGNEKNSPIHLANTKSVPTTRVLNEPNNNSDESERIPTELRKAKSESKQLVDESSKDLDGSVEQTEKSSVGTKKVRSDETCKELVVCEEKAISSGLSNKGQVKSAPKLLIAAADDDEGGDVDIDEDEGEEDWKEGLDEEEIEIKEEIEKEESIDEKEINIPSEQRPKQVVSEVKELHQHQEIALPISPVVKKQAPPVNNNVRIHTIPTKTKSVPASDRFQRIPERQNRLQSLVDLVMWRDVSKSAFIFGIGTFIIISSSYTKNINISLISVVSYLGLVYLAAIFLFRSIICRGVIYIDDTNQSYILGEEEAVWLMKKLLPYLNEFLLKLRALFSGDPATTMKLAVQLFVLARCASSISIWNMAKLGFFGVFTVPKICSSYSPQLTAYGKFWVRRFRDAWDSCSNKKVVAFGIFTLVWNLSSAIARIWALFMLFVAFKYYQQSVMSDADAVAQGAARETTWQVPVGEPGRRRGRPTVVDTKKEKKRY